jgi:hypothetical protein
LLLLWWLAGFSSSLEFFASLQLEATTPCISTLQAAGGLCTQGVSTTPGRAGVANYPPGGALVVARPPTAPFLSCAITGRVPAHVPFL